MSLAALRVTLAASLSADLSAVAVTIYPYLPAPVAIGSGWLVLRTADTQDITFGEVARITFDVMVALGTDHQQAESKLDALIEPLIGACVRLGRDVSISPVTLAVDSSDFYCAVGTFVTELEA